MIFRAEPLVFPYDAHHANEVDNALELALRPDGELDRDRLRAQAIDNVGQAAEEVRPDLIHLVGEDDTGNLVLVALTPHRFGLGLDALVGIEHAYGPVQHAQRALHLDGEIHVPRGVDDV